MVVASGKPVVGNLSLTSGTFQVLFKMFLDIFPKKPKVIQKSQLSQVEDRQVLSSHLDSLTSPPHAFCGLVVVVVIVTKGSHALSEGWLRRSQ